MGVKTDGEREAAAAVTDDRAAFAEIYRAHSAQVFSHFLQRGVPRADAEDLTAEVFAITWRRRADVVPHPTAGLLPWLLGTANNLIRDSHRSITRARRALARVDRTVDVPDVVDALTAVAQDRSRIADLAGILGKLTIPDQEIIQFCVLRGFSATTVSDLSRVLMLTPLSPPVPESARSTAATPDPVTGPNPLNESTQHLVVVSRGCPWRGRPSGLKMVVRSPVDVVLAWSC